jgi:hypothetical protein
MKKLATAVIGVTLAMATMASYAVAADFEATSRITQKPSRT